MRKIIIANWKMNLDFDQTLKLARDYNNQFKKLKGFEVLIAPSAPMLGAVGEIIKKSKIGLVSQNIAPFKQGSYTGEISATMVKQLGCRYTLVGHSERRQHFAENDEMIHRKVTECYEAGLTPILCLSESLAEREQGRRDAVIINQLHQALSGIEFSPEKEIIIAYEPVWAIGSGLFVEREDLEQVERIIKRALSHLVSEKFYTEKAQLLYGGSVNSKNVVSFWGVEKFSGFLVATASLEAKEFFAITELMK